MSFSGHILRRKDIINDLLLGVAYGTRGRRRPKVRYSDNIRVEEVCFSCTEWHRIQGNGEPRRFILNLSLDVMMMSVMGLSFHSMYI